MTRYFRAVPCADVHARGQSLAGGLTRFTEIEVLSRVAPAEVLPAEAVAEIYPEAAPILARIARPRAPICGLVMDRPRVMGVVNVTPDSFSDGGRLADADAAVSHGLCLVEAGADILDVGGESTRPGADPVPEQQELDRVLPVIEGLVRAGCVAPISIDTRKASVARAALAAGARLFNDVSALSYDPESGAAAAKADAVCLMHAQGDPRTMQDAPVYDDVLLDVYDFLAARLAACDVAGLDPAKMIVDPGIGFGKTVAHNLALLRGLSLFQSLGVPVLLGVSRKGFIGKLSGETMAARRAPGSIAAGLAGLAEGVQILRVHDVGETVQAVRVWQALREERA
ncbi:MAG: dihydropteroate synthase [Pseudomonadota bacterium]